MSHSKKVRSINPHPEMPTQDPLPENRLPHTASAEPSRSFRSAARIFRQSYQSIWILGPDRRRFEQPDHRGAWSPSNGHSIRDGHRSHHTGGCPQQKGSCYLSYRRQPLFAPVFLKRLIKRNVLIIRTLDTMRNFS